MLATRASLLLGLAGLCSALLSAQVKSPSERLAFAHSLYYTPTTAGLKSFTCDAQVDWKALLTRVSGSDTPDDDATLKYLQTVHLAIADDLKGQGSLQWNAPAAPPADKEQAIKQMQQGFQTAIGGFFQSWNAYMNGSMVPMPDSTVTVTANGDGLHLSGTSKEMQFDEDFDKNILLTQVLVVTPDLKVLAKPTYVSTPDGLIVSAVTSQINQPPSAPVSEVTFRTEYAKVDSFQIPSRLIVDVKNVTSFEVALSSCKVVVADWAKKP